jgi:serine/threonine protein kinase/dipeptidyl aminopeptidase/acylaminoacyl peptidase
MSEPLGVNTTLSHYCIIAKIGAGGMGEVYLAQDTKLDRAVALKVLSAEVARDQQRLSRFLQEARAASKLKSAHVAHIYEIGEAEEHHFIAMEYVEGQPLNKQIGGQPMAAGEIVKLGIQIARALDEAHSKGVTHRDIKPQNIIVTSDGEVKVLDFGLAKLSSIPSQAADLTPDSELATKVKTSPGIVMGTVNYMSPEQSMGRDVDHRSDIFSLGVVLYEMATGRVPFSGASLTETIDRIAHAQPEAIARFNYNVPTELEVIIKKALRKNRDERYQSARDLLVDLRNLERELEFAARIEHSVAPSTSDSTPPASSEQATEILTSGQPSLITSETPITPTHLSSAEYLTKEIKRHKKGVAIVLAVALLAAGGIAFGLYKFFSHKQRFNLQTGKITRLTSSGKVGSATISPDGKYVAYNVLDDLGQASLWVRYVATGSNVQIVPPAGADVSVGQTAFSPDGNYIYYLRNEKLRVPGVLYQVPVLGGTSKKLLENVSQISFSPDGKRFAFERRYASEGEDAVIIANADGTGEQKVATRKHPDFFLGGAAWSPDGRTIACPIGGFTGGYYRSIGVINISDGTQRVLPSHRWNDVERLAWLPDGSGLITTAQERAGDQYQLWQISYPGGESRTLTNDLSDYHLVSLTADAGALVTVLSDTTANVWLVPYGEWTNGRQLTSSKANGLSSIAFLQDGRIMYDSRAGGNPDLWIMDAEGRNQKQLTDDTYTERSARATDDGRYVVFDCWRSGTIQLWRMDVDGTNAKLLTATPGFNATVSPDGKWVIFGTFTVGGFSIWKVSIDGGEPVQITHKYSLNGTISPDGKLIACSYQDERTIRTKIALIPFEGGEPSKLFDLPGGAQTGRLRWLPDGRALTYIVNHGGVSNIWIQPLDGSSPRQLTDFKADRIYSFDWSRDGKWLVLSRGPEQRDVVLMTDFK